MLFFIIIAIYLKDEVISKCTCDSCYLYTQDTRRKVNVHKTFRRGPGRLQNVLCTFNLIPVSRGHRHIVKLFKERGGRKEYFLQGSYMKQCTQKWTKKNLWRTSFKISKWYSPSLTFLGGFMEPSVLVSLCWLASTEESSCEYGCAKHQLRTLRKHLGRRNWGGYWCFLTSSSTCSQSSNSCLTVWVKVPSGLRVCLNWATFRAKALQLIITIKYFFIEESLKLLSKLWKKLL